jgi:hypothetical protein
MEENTEKKKISHDVVVAIKKYIEIDDNIKKKKEEIKILNNEKITFENQILKYLNSINECIINTNNNKIKKNISKIKGNIKKDHINTVLSSYINDTNKVSSIMERILESITTKERIFLTRTVIK